MNENPPEHKIQIDACKDRASDLVCNADRFLCSGGFYLFSGGKRVSTRKKTDEYSNEMVTVNCEIMIKIKLLKKMLNTLFRILNNNHRMILRNVFYNRYVVWMHMDSTGKCLHGRPDPALNLRNH